ncbi:DNA-(apurinic or apyrimidinic site) endonuclease-like [Argiope bruennichi]|uniref:DNA-(apurinic or apyrimidinic site) endonuclease n=1 Tax=Argiope bruennichi TaxID=94029 RepID=A0A8T0EL14_ARGBR|nr:DNA-(apurinic or apyrimidinic site) endonuclease-like [Argiope bruennichi]KAF8774660.1 DNA-(apurinic or apyrimidinic site) lyase like protein [Argiope bruennichi]
MAPKGRGRKKAEVVEEKLTGNDAVIDEGTKTKRAGKVEKGSKKGASKEILSSDIENGLNGSGEPQEKASAEDDQVEIESKVPTDDKIPSKRSQKSAKAKDKEEPAEDEENEESSIVKDSKTKDLPSRRGRKAAKIQNGVDSTKNEETHEMKSDTEVKDLPRSRRKVKDAEHSNSTEEQNKPEPKETKAKAKTNKKAKVQSEENLVEEEVPSKGTGRKRKNAAEKNKLEAAKKLKDEKPGIDKNRQLRVALKRNHSLDEMARQQMENDAEVAKQQVEKDAEVAKQTVEKDAEVAEERKVKNVKGPAKGKGKRAAKVAAEESQPTKKAKEDASKSKGAAKKEKDKIPDVTALDFDNESKSTNGKPWNLKIATWNVNGIRAWLEKNGLSYLHHEKPDIMCIQETKCSDDKLPPEVNNIDGYHSYWLAGDKDGYSGVGLLSKEEPISVHYGIDIEKHDNEGRVITAEYDKFYLVTTYIPNAGRGLVRLDYRQEWDKDFRAYIKKLDEKKPVVLCGDLNVAHEEIDLANPKSNKKNAGFTKEEREGFSTLLSEGFVDTFRHLYPDQTGAYTFWTYMMNARAKNVGWRLDYFIISKRFTDHLCDSVIRKDVYGSDHCPITLFLHV